jgi:alkylhydroperoxidase/carboxymuconolactone decarboxylase family protein YurZ
MGEVVIEVGELDHARDPAAASGRLGNPADVSDVGIIGPVGEQPQSGEFWPRQSETLELGASRRGQLVDLVEQRSVSRVRRNPAGDALDVHEDRFTEARALPRVLETSDLARHCVIHRPPLDRVTRIVARSALRGKEADTTLYGGTGRVRRRRHVVSASPDEGDEIRRPAATMFGVESTQTSAGELLLRGLAEGDDRSVRSVLVLTVTETSPHVQVPRVLSPYTASLVHLAALLATEASTTSLRWGVEMARDAGAGDEAIVEVLSTVASTVGWARVVAAAPRLALAIGYDIEVEGWDGY